MRVFLRWFLVLVCFLSFTSLSAAEERMLRVALFADSGSSRKGITTVKNQLAQGGQAEVVLVKSEQIASGILSGFDVVVFTGGSGSRQAEALGEKGRENIRQFVRAGGGYVGICAGAYLACSGFNWGIGLINAKTVDARWRRGVGTVKMEVTQAGLETVGLTPGLHDVRYANGPILAPHNRADLSAYETIAIFRTELSENNTPEGIMVNSPAIARGYFGKGRVLLSSPHLESTDGLKAAFAPAAVRWVADQNPDKPAPHGRESAPPSGR